ncbi:unnamed protein product, partial [Ectocarpus sp. 12 AP-2014]
MDNFLSAVAQLKAAKDTKYDVIYVNTPWNKLSVEQMGKIDLSSLTKDEALMYMWADTYTINSSIELFKTQGFKFESVYQVCDVASYPSSPTPQEPKLTKPSQAEAPVSMPVPVPVPVPAAETSAPENKAETEVEATGRPAASKRAKKQRCPPLTLPKYWKEVQGKGSTRPTTEFLLLGRKGGRDVLDKLMNDKAGTLPYQVVRRPDLGKKSRSVPKKNINLDPEWVCDRPTEFLDTAMTHLKPSVKILEVFGSTLRKTTDSIGPNVPGGFCPAYASTTGLANCLNKVMRSMKKVQLQSLCSGLSKMAQADCADRDAKVSTFKAVEPMWAEIIKSLSDIKSPVCYDWSSEDADLPAEWLRLVVLSFAQKNTADFGDLRRKRKKRKTNKDSPRACHGIAKPVMVSKELTDFLGLEEGHMVSRTHTVKLLNNYVKANGLQNPAKKIEIVPDEPLAKLLSPPADFGPITYFKMCSLLGPHFPKETQEAKDAKILQAKEAKQAAALA